VSIAVFERPQIRDHRTTAAVNDIANIAEGRFRADDIEFAAEVYHGTLIGQYSAAQFERQGLLDIAAD
jgi:hypothetical protein